MLTREEIWQAIEQADALPYGRARIARLEDLMVLADELDGNLVDGNLVD